MSERSAKDTSTSSSPQSALKPALKGVLESLDVQLEAELTRYRRQKRGEQFQPSYAGNGLTPPQKTALNLIALTPTGSSTESLGTRSLQPGQELNLEGNKPLELSEGADAEASSHGNGTPEKELPLPAIASGSEESELASAQSAGGADAATGSAAAGGAMVRADRPRDPDDYLESSEKLVNSLDRQEGKPPGARSARRQKSPQNTLLSPLGIGSMLLFLLASGTLAYVVANSFGGERVVGDRTRSLENPKDPRTPETSTDRAPLSVTPDLTNPQFKPLELDRLGTIDDKPTATAPAPSDRPAEAPSPSVAIPTPPAPVPQTAAPSLDNLNTDYLTRSGQPMGNQPPTTAPSSAAPTAQTGPNPSPAPVPEPAAASAPESPALSSSVSAESFPAFYYVVMDYQNDESLWNAREVVPDAYVREFPIGVKIQVAAFEDEASAKTMVEQINKQGMSAQMYKP